MHVTHLVIGAGPTGLGAALCLKEQGVDDFLLLERNNHAGGLAASFQDRQGFTWDFGGHVLFSHYPTFDHQVAAVMGDEFLEHERVSFVRSHRTWVPYPFQNNIRHLPPLARWKCIRGLMNRPKAEPENFLQWINAVFGPGIGDVFMRPYNFKVWATPAERMSYAWIGERVSVVELSQVLANVLHQQDDVAWGPNNTFRFPARGGTGEIFRRMADTLGDRVRYRSDVGLVHGRKKEVRTVSGETITYDHLLCTGPLDLLVQRWLVDVDDAVMDEMTEASRFLEHNSVHVTGIGLDGPDSPHWPRPDQRCWMYFPEPDCPFYRVTNFHHYSPGNTAKPGEQRALMCETSSSDHKLEDLDTLADRCGQGLRRTTLMAPDDRVVTTFERTKEYGYPVPTLGRDQALAVIQPRLEALDIYARGRFGGWKYEVGNMDHSFMQGWEWALRMVRGQAEETYSIPTN